MKLKHIHPDRKTSLISEVQMKEKKEKQPLKVAEVQERENLFLSEILMPWSALLSTKFTGSVHIYAIPVI